MAHKSALEIAATLESMLKEKRATRAVGQLAQLKKTMTSERDDYTSVRAAKLLQTSTKLKSVITQSRKGSYSDRAHALAVVSDSYLRLAHAFKVDADVWTRAQSDLVPALSIVTTEKDIDGALTKLSEHIDAYISSLNAWLRR
jgi:hypothetical protein